MRLLLDYPWDIDAARGSDPVPQKAIKDFLDLLSRTGLDPVPFIDHQACEDLFSNIQQHRAGKNFHQLLSRFLKQCVRDADGACRAAPDLTPTDLRDSWKCALREELGNLEDWRNPHIVVPESRMSEWELHENEVAIRCEECDDQPASGLHHRVLAVLERYESHPFAISDLDPWDLQRIHPPIPDRPRQHPALLPKPRLPIGFPLQNLHEYLNVACAYHWEIDGNYYFIPPMDFDPLGIAKETWRKGRAFRYETVPNSDRSGPVDYNGIVWSWDEHERHWDVQTKPKHMRISHTGKRLPDPD